MKNLIHFSNYTINENKTPVILLNIIADLKTTFLSRGFKLIQSSRHYLHFINELNHNINIVSNVDDSEFSITIKLKGFEKVRNRDRWVKHYESIIVPVIKPLYSQLKSESIYVVIDIFGIIVPLHLLDSDAQEEDQDNDLFK